jgi:hypothetical protein
MAIFDVSLYEPISAVVTADTIAYTADNATWPTADGGILEGATDQVYAAVNANVLFADLNEPVTTQVTADTTAYRADNTIWPTADGGILEGATDQLDAIVIPAEAAIGGGYYPPLRRFLVEGVGYGILPELEGEGLGVVIVDGAGIGALAELKGAATGMVDVAGRSAGQIIIRATAAGHHGQAGTAIAVFKDISIASQGAVGVCGSGSGAIVKFQAIAIGRHDDDEAAVMTFLLAA